MDNFIFYILVGLLFGLLPATLDPTSTFSKHSFLKRLIFYFVFFVLLCFILFIISPMVETGYCIPIMCFICFMMGLHLFRIHWLVKSDADKFPISILIGVGSFSYPFLCATGIKNALASLICTVISIIVFCIAICIIALAYCHKKTGRKWFLRDAFPAFCRIHLDFLPLFLSFFLISLFAVLIKFSIASLICTICSATIIYFYCMYLLVKSENAKYQKVARFLLNYRLICFLLGIVVAFKHSIIVVIYVICALVALTIGEHIVWIKVHNLKYTARWKEAVYTVIGLPFSWLCEFWLLSLCDKIENFIVSILCMLGAVIAVFVIFLALGAVLFKNDDDELPEWLSFKKIEHRTEKDELK